MMTDMTGMPGSPGGAGPNPDSAGESTADRLLRLSAALFRQKGYAASSTRELAAHLGIQKASLYHHIRGKEDLLFAISAGSLERITASVAAAGAAAEPAGRLQAMIAAHLQTALADQDMHTTMLIELRSLSPDRQEQVRMLRDQYQGLLRDAIAAGQADGRLRVDIEAGLLTLALLNMLNWTIVWFDAAGPCSPSQLADLLTKIFLDGARARPA